MGVNLNVPEVVALPVVDLPDFFEHGMGLDLSAREYQSYNCLQQSSTRYTCDAALL